MHGFRDSIDGFWDGAGIVLLRCCADMCHSRWKWRQNSNAAVDHAPAHSMVIDAPG
jgi:hypothetical protein